MKEHKLFSEEEEAEYAFLNTLDILDYIKIAAMGDFEVWQVKENIQDREIKNYQKFLKENNLTVTEGGEEYVFNCIDDYDFIDYVEKRYPENVSHREIITTNLTFNLLEEINEEDEN